jgi:hypothetical protein
VDPPLKDWIESKSDVVAIAYHVWWPYAGDPFYLANPEPVAWRVDYCGITSVPAIRFDGPHNPTPYNPTSYEALYQARKAIPSSAAIELEGAYDPGTRSGELVARVIAESELVGDRRLRVVLTESDIFYAAPNGIDIHDDIFRRFVPDTTGTMLTFSAPYPDTVEVVLPFEVDVAWTAENVRLVAMLQEQGSTEIEQGAAVDVTGLSVAVNDAGAPVLPAADRLHPVRPNPFNPAARVGFTLASEARALVRVFDARGRQVRVLLDATLAAGRHDLVWDGRDAAGREVASGVYIVRLDGGGDPSTVRAVLLR